MKDILKSDVYGISNPTEPFGQFEVLGMGDIVESRVLFPSKRFVDNVDLELLLQKDDLLFNRTNSIALVGKVGLVEQEVTNVTFASYLVRLRLANRQSPKFWAYFLNGVQFGAWMRSHAIQTANQANLSSYKLRQFEVFEVPEDTQKAIASYLDRETERIDGKVALLEKKARLYKELKQSLINETVTRGLDPSAPLRDSGVDWIGEIPEHWEVKRVVDVAEQWKKKNLGLRNKNLLSLSYGRIKRRDFNTAHGLLPASFETYQVVNSGNIILRLTDLQNDWKSLRVGLVRESGIITSAYLNLRVFKVCVPTYFYYLLHSFDIAKVFYWQGGGLRQSMKFDDIKILPTIIPPLEEQKAIAKYLDEKTAKIDQITEAIAEQVRLLKELRKTLINDVVTGKIRVTETEGGAA